MMLAVCAAVLIAASDPRLESGVLAYQSGDFAAASRALQALADDRSAPAALRSEARKYLAAAAHARGQLTEAVAHLQHLFDADPQAVLDPGTFLPDLLALAEKVRSERAARTAPPPDPPAVARTTPSPTERRAEPRREPPPEVVPKPKHTASAIEIREAPPAARSLKGALSLGAGAALAAFGAVQLVGIANNAERYRRQQPGGPDFDEPTLTRAEMQRDRVMYPISIGAAAVGLSLSGLGVYWLVAEGER